MEDDDFGPVTEHELDECREREQHCKSSASPAGSTAPDVVELATNIRRNTKKMLRHLNPEGDSHGVLIDYVNHIDALASQIENSG